VAPHPRTRPRLRADQTPLRSCSAQRGGDDVGLWRIFAIVVPVPSDRSRPSCQPGEGSASRHRRVVFRYSPMATVTLIGVRRVRAPRPGEPRSPDCPGPRRPPESAFSKTERSRSRRTFAVQRCPRPPSDATGGPTSTTRTATRLLGRERVHRGAAARDFASIAGGHLPCGTSRRPARAHRDRPRNKHRHPRHSRTAGGPTPVIPSAGSTILQ